ncbi:MAG: hypothetical protein RLY43_1121 [Bacteroidota bacterium]|jgi:hypothetical protein
MRSQNNLIDKYFDYPIFFDLILVIVFWFLTANVSIFNLVLTDKNNQINIIPNIISADFAFAGFILAALTIIVTFRSNIQTKNLNEASNALELIFSTNNYNKIVKVFRLSLVELVLCYIFLFCSWLSIDNFDIWKIYRINISGIIITTLSIGRSLFILFIVIDLDKHKRSNK